MNMKLAKIMPSHVRMLADCGDISTDKSSAVIIEVLDKAGATDKNGNAISPVLTDMSERQNGIVICNLGADDQNAPISEYLTANHADRVAQGLKLLAKAGGCEDVLIYAPKGCDTAMLAEQLGELNIQIKTGECSQVLREPTALYQLLDKGAIRTATVELEFKRQFMSEGWQSRPTLVVDAETACNIASVVENEEAEISKLVVVISDEAIITEVKVGTPISTLMAEFGISAEKPALIGGMLGRFIASSDAEAEKVAFSWMHDSVTLYTEAHCMAKVTAELLAEVRAQSCQKCVMCREGSFQLSTLFASIIEGKAKREDIALIEDITPLIAQGALCDFGMNMAECAITALTLNRSVIEAHILKKTCPAGVCESFKSFYIDPKRCTGCGDCVDVCDYDAIDGKAKFIHVIDQKMCEKCGECVNECPEGAIVTNKIRVPKRPMRVGTFK